MYKIGDEVETPIGTGTIKWIDKASKNDDEGFDTLYVSIKGMPEIEFNERFIKPYQSAHDKLLALGYERIENNEKYAVYKKIYESDEYHSYYEKINIYKKIKKYDGTFYSNDNFNSQYHYHQLSFNLELSRILTQYLEEL